MEKNRRALVIGAAAALAALAGVAALLISSDAGGGGSGWLAGDGHPVQLELKFEPERGRAKEITPRGGVVSATSSDGTRFELRIPEGALVYPERISIIPISSVKGLPLDGGSVAAVHLKPEGLRLMKPATLRIRPRKDIPVSEQAAFAYTGNGSDAYLYPLSRDPRRIEMPIFHFSGYGLGQAPPNDPGRRVLQQAADKMARLQSQIAEITSKERARQLADDDAPSTWTEDIAPFVIEFYDQVVRPRMVFAEADDRMAECALQVFLGWLRQVLLLGYVPDGDDGEKGSFPEIERRANEGQASMWRILENAHEKRTAKALKRCREEHDFLAVNEIVGMAREAQLLGLKKGTSVDWEAIRKCLSFEIEFRSVIEQKTPTGGTYYHTVANVPMSIDILSNEVATAPIEYEAFRASGNPMKDLYGGAGPDKSTIGGLLLEEGGSGQISPAGTKPGTFTLVKLDMTSSRKPFRQTNCEGEDEDQERETIDSLIVTFSPGVPKELVRLTPDHAGETTSIAKMMAAFAQVMGDEALASEARETGRIGGAFVMEETGWLRRWNHFHGRDEVQRPSGMVANGDEIGGEWFMLALHPVTPGVWRTDFKSEEPPELGFSQKESGYMIVRHTPR